MEKAITWRIIPVKMKQKLTSGDYLDNSVPIRTDSIVADTQDLVYKPADEVGSLRNNLRNHQKIMELPKTLTKINTKMGREGA